MKREEIFERVVKCIQYVLAYQVVHEIKEELNLFDDLGFDSLDSIELIMECEKEFDISITDTDAEKITTVKEIVDYLEKEVK